MPESETEVEKKKESPSVGVSGRKIIYDKDGKPCRTCNTLQDFQFATQGGSVAPTFNVKKPLKKNHPDTTSNDTIAGGYTKDQPPDVEQLGKSSWTLLHSVAATYPETPTSKQQADMKQFILLFGNFYPCWFCGKDFQEYIEANEVQTATQDDLGKWLCVAHNAVNKKIGKAEFDCNLWKQRWKDGWEK